ncbi:MAG: MarR family transcriptional regulator [Gammaproteobacteria bacterium]|nr:MarR family transcriptional regulator [Gammaproteobacteria bacterium]
MASEDNFGLLLGETARIWRNRLDQRLRPLGLSQAKWQLLVQLHLAEDDLTQIELSSRLGIEGPTLVRLLDRMEEDGWVERRLSSSDRRAKTVHGTAKARAIMRDIRQIAGRLRAELLSGLSPQDLAVASAVLKQIKQRAEQNTDEH